MPIRITNERIFSIAKKLDIDIENRKIEQLLDTIMDKIETLAKGNNHKWKNENAEIMKFYNDATEEMEKALEYEGAFF